LTAPAGRQLAEGQRPKSTWGLPRFSRSENGTVLSRKPFRKPLRFKATCPLSRFSRSENGTVPFPNRRAISQPRPSGGSRRGIVLFIVMIVIVMLSLAGLSFVITMSTENKAVHLCGDELQIEQVAASGEELLKAFSGLSPDARQEAGGYFDNPDLFRGVLVLDDGPHTHRARFSIVSPRMENGRLAGIRFGAENESARLNLAVLPQWEEQHEGAAREALLNLPDMTESIADAILDWIDVDAAPRSLGAEAEYYAGLGLPYGPRNGIPTSLDELLLIRGVSRELLFGADADFNHQVEDAELQFASNGPGIGMGQERLPWASLLTVSSAERNTSCDGSPRINLNEKDLAKLHAQLSEVFDPSWADFIIAYRQFGPFAGPPDGIRPGTRRRGRGPFRRGSSGPAGHRGLVRRPATTPGVRRSATTGDAPEIDLSLPAKYNIDSVLDLVGVDVLLGEPDELPPDRRPADEEPPPDAGPSAPGSPPPHRPPPLLESPFAADRLAMQEYLPKLADQTTVVSDKILRGRINVNEAPRAVLLAVPGLDRSTVDQIITARGLRTSQDDPARRHAVWLLIEGIVELEQMKELLPYLTTVGDVFRAQVVGYFDDSGPSARAEVVVDGTTSPPRQVYWKDLRLLGRGYTMETLGAEGSRKGAKAQRE